MLKAHNSPSFQKLQLIKVADYRQFLKTLGTRCMKIAKLNINDTQMRSDLKITEIPIKGFGKLISLKGDKFTQKDIYDFIGKNDYNVSLFFYNQSISDIKFGAVL